MLPYTITHEDADLRVAQSQNLVVAVWREAPSSLTQMHTIEALNESTRKEHPAGAGYVNVIVAGTPRFSKEIRDDAARQTRETPENALASAHVVLVGGLTGVAVRSFLSTMLLVGRPKVPSKVFGDIKSAAAWTAEKLSGPGRIRWVAAELEELLVHLADFKKT